MAAVAHAGVECIDDARSVEMIVAKLRPVGDEHRHALAVHGLQRRIAVDVDDLDSHAVALCDRCERFEHVIAQMAPRTAIDGEPHYFWARGLTGTYCDVSPRRTSKATAFDASSDLTTASN